MADDNNTTSVEVPRPDFKRMAKVMTKDLKPLSEEGAKVRGDQSAAWKVIADDCHCNKRAAKALFKLLYESDETRDDYLRTFLPGLKALGLIPENDLVDIAEGVTPATKPMGTDAMAAMVQ